MLSNPSIGGGEVLAVDGFVAQTPYYDTWAVAVYGNVMLVALQYLASEHRLIGRSIGRVITESVALLISFGNEIDAQFVAHMIPLRIVGVVAGAHGVNIKTLHQHDVLQHTLATHHITAVGVHLMSVNTFY